MMRFSAPKSIAELQEKNEHELRSVEPHTMGLVEAVECVRLAATRGYRLGPSRSRNRLVTNVF
ncbi:hypothetical protein RERY_23990 [Rhodococcus erythropolis]|nr:hypothetical protein RERY_23990 [Rhodococcus erythropolis]